MPMMFFSRVGSALPPSCIYMRFDGGFHECLTGVPLPWQAFFSDLSCVRTSETTMDRNDEFLGPTIASEVNGSEKQQHNTSQSSPTSVARIEGDAPSKLFRRQDFFPFGQKREEELFVRAGTSLSVEPDNGQILFGAGLA